MWPSALRFVLVAVALVFATAAGPRLRGAQGDEDATPIELTSEDPLIIDGRSGELVARKHARVVFGEWVLIADEIRVHRETKQATATGHVLATRPGLRLLAHAARFDQTTGRIEVEQFRFGRPPFYATGSRGYGTAEEMTFENVEVFYGEPGRMTPRATVRLLKINRRDELLDADGLRISIGSLPVLAMSGLVRPLTGPRLVWETRAGYESSLGAELGVGVYYPVADGFNPGGSVDVFTSRGVMFGPGIRYERRTETGALAGEADVLFIHDTGNRRLDALGRPIEADRYVAVWRHEQRGERWTLNTDLNWWSDSAVLRDFRENEFDRNQDPDNHLEAAWYGSSFILSAFTRFRPNDFQAVAERLPEIRFDLLPTPIAETGALLRVESSAARLREKPVGGGPAARSDRFDLYAGLDRTLQVARGVTFTPVLGGRLTHYSRALDGRGDYTRWLGEIGFDARLRAHRTRELQKPLWGIDGVRHIIEPVVQYRYVPRADRGRRFIPDIDRPAFLTQLQPLGLADRRDLDALDEIHAVRFGLNNIVQTRRAEYGSRQLLSFNIAGDVTIGDRSSGRDFSHMQAELRLTPADWLDAWFFLRIDPEDASLEEFNTRVTLADAEAWSLGIDSDFLSDDLDQIETFGRYRFNEAYEGFAAVRYDVRERRFNEITIGLNTQIAQLWALRTGLVFRDGPRRESSFGLRLNLRFLAF